MKCKICKTQALPFLRLSTDGLDESFLDDSLRRMLPELKLDCCSECGSLWASDERQDETLLLEAYRRTLDAYFGSREIPSRFASFYMGLEGLLLEHTPIGTILDVGCGDGAFLATLSAGWSKLGLEPSKNGVHIAQSRNLQVECGTLKNCFQTRDANVLSALDVLEHIVDPHSFIESVKCRLARGCVLLLVTGDAGSWAARQAGRKWSYLRWCGHVSVFSATGLVRLLKEHGFEIVMWQRCDHPAGAGGVAWWRVHVLEPVRYLLGRKESWYPFWYDHQTLIARLG